MRSSMSFRASVSGGNRRHWRTLAFAVHGSRPNETSFSSCVSCRRCYVLKMLSIVSAADAFPGPNRNVATCDCQTCKLEPVSGDYVFGISLGHVVNRDFNTVGTNWSAFSCFSHKGQNVFD